MMPCKDCPDRHLGCHSECEKYQEELQSCEAKYKQKYFNSITTGYKIKFFNDMKRRKHK